MKRPADCQSMTDIRTEIDRIDDALMTLFSERWSYIHRAAEIKRPLGLAADIPARVEEVRRNARRNAMRHGLDPDFYDDMWERLIRQAIRHEERVMRGIADPSDDRT